MKKTLLNWLANEKLDLFSSNCDGFLELMAQTGSDFNHRGSAIKLIISLSEGPF